MYVATKTSIADSIPTPQKPIKNNSSNIISNTNFVKPTKASFADCPISDRALFSQSNCILPISIMGNKELEGQRFIATMKLVNRSFKSCTLLLGDNLCRHTLRMNNAHKNEAELSNLATSLGNEWLARNQDAYSQLVIPTRVIRWDKYLQHPKFQHYFSIVNNLYATDMHYQNAVNINIEQYLARYFNRFLSMQTNSNYAYAFSCCLEYLKEECAGMCLWAEDGYDFEIYPTGRCAAMAAIYENLIKHNYPSCLRPVSIRFKK